MIKNFLKKAKENCREVSFDLDFVGVGLPHRIPLGGSFGKKISSILFK